MKRCVLALLLVVLGVSAIGCHHHDPDDNTKEMKVKVDTK